VTVIKKPTAVFMSVIMLSLSVFTLFANATTAEIRYFERGILNDGENPTYYLVDKDNRTLYITGNGYQNAMTLDYPSEDQGPFAGRTDITRIVIEEDVAKVGDYVCANLKNVDTLEIQSNLLSSSSSMSSKAMIGCTSLRNIQADSSLVSTNVLLEVVKGALNIVSGNWLSLIRNGISVVSTGVSGDGSLSNEVVHAMVNDYIMTGEEIFFGDLDQAVYDCQQREQEPCYWENAYHHQYTSSVLHYESCLTDGETEYVCSVCGDNYTVHFGMPLGHNYVSEVLYESQCTKEGVSKAVCSRCSDTVISLIPAKGHTDGKWVLTVIPTRTSAGRVECLCKDCSEITKNSEINYYAATYIKYRVNLDAQSNTAAQVCDGLTTTGLLVYAVKDGVVMDDSEKVGTGSTIYSIQVSTKRVYEVDTAVLYGDVDGDGLINADDYSLMDEYVMGDSNKLPDGSAFRRAADLNGDGFVDAFDLSLLDLQISGARELDQTRAQY